MKNFLYALFTFAAFCAPPCLAATKTLSQALHEAQQNNDAKILSAKTVVAGKKRFHRIKMLTKTGRVRVILVDANSPTGETNARTHR
jgi:hypothetical protein